jgi:hypothetical protein
LKGFSTGSPYTYPHRYYFSCCNAAVLVRVTKAFGLFFMW